MPDLPLILASSSPRRLQLLTAAGYSFTTRHPSDGAECGVCSRETPPEMVARLALQKAEDVAKHVDRGIVIGCDTVAECCGLILGKPKNRDHAREMLTLLSGREHKVYSGLCLRIRPGDEAHVSVDVTRLQMDVLAPETIEAYLDTDLWEGKAGSFGYQDGNDWVRVLEGSESNVVGLPLELLQRMLKQTRTASQ